MPYLHSAWTSEELNKLRDLAGKQPPAEIAKQIGRSKAATTIKAHEIKISLRWEPEPGRRLNWPKAGVS